MKRKRQDRPHQEELDLLKRFGEMVYKLRYYVPLSTLKIVCFSLFHLQIFLVELGKNFQKYSEQIINPSN